MRIFRRQRELNPDLSISASPREFADALGRHGVIVVRDALGAANAARLAAFTADVYRALAGAIAGSAQPIDPTLRENFVVWEGLWLHGVPAFCATHDDRLGAEWHDLLQDINRAFARVVTELNWSYCPERSFVRKLKNGHGTPEWHADFDTAGTMGYGVRCYNLWVPLRDVGVDAPAVEFAVGSHTMMRNEAPLKPGEWRQDAWVDQHAAARWTPALKLGDVALFDHFLLHRTQRTAPTMRDRMSYEIRFVHPTG